jgi:gas vesicle structural protein
MSRPLLARPAALTLTRPRGRERPVSLAEILDRVLNTGAVVTGEVVIGVAGVDLIYLGLNVVLTSVETARNGKHSGEVNDARI